MAMAAMNMVSAVGFSGVSFPLRTCPQGVASVLTELQKIRTFSFSKRRPEREDGGGGVR